MTILHWLNRDVDKHFKKVLEIFSLYMTCILEEKWSQKISKKRFFISVKKQKTKNTHKKTKTASGVPNRT